MKDERNYISNDIDATVHNIQKAVENGKKLFVLFPLYNPDLELNMDYDVVGKAENQELIARKLKSKGVDSLHIAHTFFTFFKNNLSKKEKEDIKKEAIITARMYDIIDD